MQRYTIHITGLVQGVGFRPFVHRTALQHGLKGTVENRNDGVWIQLLAGGNNVDDFIASIREKKPPAAEIRSIEITSTGDSLKYPDFRILESRDVSGDITLVSPDIAVCTECLEDMKLQRHRSDYPFINCTNCGPRFTIIEDLPYDRSRTTMKEFEMCQVCRKEYEDVGDRRFHAQPVACHTCGPQYTLHFDGKEIRDLGDILKTAGRMLQQGKLLAVKGMGGYFLVCDALNEGAVVQLRRAKIREDKPFAVMFRDMRAVGRYARVSKEEEEALTSWRRPIVLLESIKALAPSVTMGFRTVGAMLPYMPFHYLLFRENDTDVLVLTSGNLSYEPIVISDDKALEHLGPVTDAVITFNRRIHNRVDDSVLHVAGGHLHLIRRSRGFAPAPLELDFSVNGILATGAELENTFCLGKGKLAFLSQHIGDLKNYETYTFYTESLERFKRIFRVSPQIVACDMHPDYLSTRYALETGLPVIRIQHHHAHIAAGIVECSLEGPVIGVAFDGTGYGTDGNIWGGEFLVCDLKHFERRYHFDYVPMPGGDRAALEPWRMGISWLWHTFGDSLDKLDFPFLRWLRENGKYEIIIEMLNKKINTPLTSGSGRLFDAVAAVTGICRESTFHAEAPMRLEASIGEKSGESYPWQFRGDKIDFRQMIKEMVRDIMNNIPAEIISLRFHQTITGVVVETAKKIREETGLNRIILSGGTFQNKFLLHESGIRLKEIQFEVYIPGKVPVNDGGISLGQLVVAAANCEQKCIRERNSGE